MNVLTITVEPSTNQIGITIATPNHVHSCGVAYGTDSGYYKSHPDKVATQIIDIISRELPTVNLPFALIH